MNAQEFLDLLNNEVLGQRNKFMFLINSRKNSLFEYRKLLNLQRFVKILNFELDKLYLAALFGKLGDVSDEIRQKIFDLVTQLDLNCYELFFKKNKPDHILTYLANYMNTGIDFIKMLEINSSKLDISNIQTGKGPKFDFGEGYFN
ncbi:MAG: hypothetical protein IIA45_02030 [Bacteroidetes bacterium]|nr:hypothetical protein [Bacteroidota bacterium]